MQSCQHPRHETTQPSLLSFEHIAWRTAWSAYGPSLPISDCTNSVDDDESQANHDGRMEEYDVWWKLDDCLVRGKHAA
jgi:hypothetical protein